MSATRLADDRPQLTSDFSGLLLKRLAVVLTVVLVAAGLAYIPTWGQTEIGQMEIEAYGDVVLIRGTESTAIRGVDSLKPGDVIRTARSSLAELRLKGDRYIALGAVGELLIVDEESAEIRKGSVKAQTSDGDRLAVVLDDVEAAPLSEDAIFRFDRGAGYARAGVYAGEVELSTPGQSSMAVPSLFEAVVTAGELPPDTTPYEFSPSDKWDREHLNEVISLDEELQVTAAGLASQLGNRRPTLGFFETLAGRKVGFMKPYLRRDVDDVLIAFSIARNVKANLAKTFVLAFDYHDDGGEWGTVATILEARAESLLAQLNRIVLATGVADGGAAGADSPDLTLSAAAAANDGTAPPPDDGGSTDPVPPPDDDPKDGDGKDDEEPKDPGDCEDGTDCTGNDIENLICDGDDDDPLLCPEDSPNGSDDSPLGLSGGDKSSKLYTGT